MRPLRDCLEETADALEGGADAHHALQEAVSSLEYHLDTLARARRQPVAEPSSLPEVERLEQQISALLLRAWEFIRAFDADQTPGAKVLSAYAGELRAASRQEIDLVFNSFASVGGED